MATRTTVDHGEIIHFAGAHHLFPVALKADAARVRLAKKDDVTADEVRVGWPVYFTPFNHQRLVFLIEDDNGRAVSRAEADAAGLAPPPKLTP